MSFVFLYKAARYEAKAHQNSKTVLFGHTPKIHHGKIRISPPIQKGAKKGTSTDNAKVSMRKVDFKKRSSPLLERFNFAFSRKVRRWPMVANIMESSGRWGALSGE